MLELESDKTESKSTLTLEFFNIRTVLKGLRTEATVRQLSMVNHISIIVYNRQNINRQVKKGYDNDLGQSGVSLSRDEINSTINSSDFLYL